MNETWMGILFALTFVFGVVRGLTSLKIFDTGLVGILQTIFTIQSGKTLFGVFIIYLDNLLFYIALCYQAWYWWVFFIN